MIDYYQNNDSWKPIWTVLDHYNRGNFCSSVFHDKPSDNPHVFEFSNLTEYTPLGFFSTISSFNYQLPSSKYFSPLFRQMGERKTSRTQVMGRRFFDNFLKYPLNKTMVWRNRRGGIYEDHFYVIVCGVLYKYHFQEENFTDSLRILMTPVVNEMNYEQGFEFNKLVNDRYFRGWSYEREPFSEIPREIVNAMPPIEVWYDEMMDLIMLGTQGAFNRGFKQLRYKFAQSGIKVVSKTREQMNQLFFRPKLNFRSIHELNEWKLKIMWGIYDSIGHRNLDGLAPEIVPVNTNVQAVSG